MKPGGTPASTVCVSKRLGKAARGSTSADFFVKWLIKADRTSSCAVSVPQGLLKAGRGSTSVVCVPQSLVKSCKVLVHADFASQRQLRPGRLSVRSVRVLQRIARIITDCVRELIVKADGSSASVVYVPQMLGRACRVVISADFAPQSVVKADRVPVRAVSNPLRLMKACKSSASAVCILQCW